MRFRLKIIRVAGLVLLSLLGAATTLETIQAADLGCLLITSPNFGGKRVFDLTSGSSSDPLPGLIEDPGLHQDEFYGVAPDGKHDGYLFPDPNSDLSRPVSLFMR